MQPCQDRTAEFRERRLGRRRRPRHPRATHRRPRLCRHHFRAPATAGPHRSGCWTRHTRVSLFLMRANDDCVLFAKSKSKGVYIYSGNSTILVLDNRRWGAGSTSTSIRPGSAKLTSAWQSRGRKSVLPFVRSQEWRTHHQIKTNPQSMVHIVNILAAAWVSSRAPCDQEAIQSSSRL